MGLLPNKKADVRSSSSICLNVTYRKLEQKFQRYELLLERTENFTLDSQKSNTHTSQLVLRGPMLKYAKLLYGLFAVIGIIFLIIFFTILADEAIYIYFWEFFSPIQHLMTFLGWFWLFGGTFFLTAGIAGIGRQYLGNNQNPSALGSFTLLAIVLVPSIVFALFCYFWMGAIEVGY